MLNPSTADEEDNDPTITRCEQFSKQWGYTGLYVTNLFAFRATLPADMKAAGYPVGPENDFWIDRIVRSSHLILCAWGNDGRYRNRSTAVVPILRNAAKTRGLHYLELTGKHEPNHPLYLKQSLQPTPWV